MALNSAYGWYNHEFRCNQIKDRNGNFITVNYDWMGHITTITDTLARTLTFNYDANVNLISITSIVDGERRRADPLLGQLRLGHGNNAVKLLREHHSRRGQITRSRYSPK